jgi:hypothetical protein
MSCKISISRCLLDRGSPLFLPDLVLVVKPDKIMIEIRWSEETNEIEVGGTPQDLQYVRQSILHLIHQTDETQIIISAAIDFDPSPYSSRLSFLVIDKSENLIRVQLAADCLDVRGNPKNLEVFADWFDFESNMSQYHCHFDYYPGNDLISPDSLPLVISVKS